ncbi:DUF4870 domain-containing protein [bacterium]|nr:DUF4870 domain-containing protein [bacterium]
MAFPSATEEQIKEGKSLAWLAYVGVAAVIIPFVGWLAGLLFLVPLLAHKDNPFSKYHGRQGMVLFMFEVAFGIIIGILWAIAGAIAVASYGYGYGIGMGICGVLVWIVIVLVGLALEVLSIIGLIQAAQGKFWKMPVIGAIAESWFKGMVPTA